jgi:hypothetical protein
MKGSILKSITAGPPLDPPDGSAPAPALVQRSPFATPDGDDGRSVLMEDIAQAFAEKRQEQKAKLKRAATLLHEACDILNSLDA